MTALQGRLTGDSAGALDRYTVTATFDLKVSKNGGGVAAAARRSAGVERDGRFTLELPNRDAVRSPVTVTAYGPSGLPAGEAVVRRRRRKGRSRSRSSESPRPRFVPARTSRSGGSCGTRDGPSTRRVRGSLQGCR